MSTKLAEPKPIESVSDSTLDAEAMNVGKLLAKMPKKTIKLPIDPLNKNETMVKVVFNGYVFLIPYGKEVELPLPVVEILERSGRY